ncbi:MULTISPECIES: S9 family peptidase [unclassified Lentimicrobium]|uniref:S9 family peptidase n=1 Tax=unclassified Lentimicrobium TaxID=2677434 RepID=UPI001551A7DF|nr:MULTISPECIES: S9 family peptidase [unclassified Lentimicrobium]NPD46829.1 S9 family peptidase [Lentimicrobium sp. S6]NPD85117.1 S9 family peptidase [Lentimicrobium sp. L6]
MKNILQICLALLLSGSLSAQTLVRTEAPKAKELSLEKIFKEYQFYPRSVRGIQAMNDGEHYCKISKEGIEEYSYATGEKTRMIIENKTLIINDSVTLKYDSYEFSPKEDLVLLSTETEAIYRHSSKSNFYIYSIEDKSLTLLSDNGKQRLASFSPDATKIAFVRENNLFIVNLADMSEKQITTDGKFESIINGTTDWVYEEEFAFTKAFFWSPNGDYIAYYKFDESKVKEFWMTYYGELYPKHEKYKYPKAGEDNSVVSIHTYQLSTGETKTMNIGEETDIYIPRMKWTHESDKLVIFWMNRLQNNLKFLLTNPTTGEHTEIYNETNEYYIEITDNFHILANKKGENAGFILTSELDGFNHVYYYNMEGKLQKQLTSGNWDVDHIIGYDSKEKVVYYQAAKSAPYNREVFGVNLKGKENPIEVKEGWNSVTFSANYKYYNATWSDANTPPVYSLKSIKGETIKVLQDNQALKDRIAEYNYQKKTFYDITTSEDVKLSTWQILPPNFDESKQYPVLFTIYGGPGSQTVKNSWGYRDAWYQYFAQQGIIVVSVDNRGTGFKGEAFKKVTYQELGKYETIDQIEAAQYFESLPYVAKDKIGIFGWSYGGYMSTLCMTKGAEHFNTGIAVAPVTNWRYYDNIYTERYMRTPQTNAAGYDDNSPINHVEKLKGNYMLIHGMADDNVHPHNAYDLITALVAADKEFELMLYPNSNHGIYTGKNTTIHLYKKMTKFYLEHLK